jgi:signal transduction histidine kinase/chemotaxis methyl-accepting protein methylase
MDEVYNDLLTGVRLPQPEERNVTRFFRDANAFAYLKREVLPKLIAQAYDRDHTLRFWAAGCATGEEPYSLAMLVTDILGAELPEWNVQIFATDPDEAAINFARLGLYSENLLKGMPTEYRERFFEHVDHGYRISKTLRQMVIFGQQDLSRSAPFPCIDLVLCRNVLINFTPELQDYVLNQFAFSLTPGGYLLLGKAETVCPNQAYYELVNKHWKVYRCIGNALPAPNYTGLSEGHVQRSFRRLDTRPSRTTNKQLTEQIQIRQQLETVRAVQAQLMNELSSANKRLNDMNKELMDFKGELQVANEALMLTREELQASIEEFKTTKEELHATNDELEIKKEELQATKEELERLRLIFDNANVAALALYDAQTAELIIASPRYLDLVVQAHGSEQGRLIGRKWHELTFIISPEQADTIWNTVMESHIPFRLPEVHYKFAKEKQERVWDWSLAPIMDTPDIVRFALVSKIDITEQVQARQEMERLNQLQDDFLSLASHELRTPLSAIKGNAELILRSLKSQLEVTSKGGSRDKAPRFLDIEQEEHMLGRIIGQANRMNKLISEMLDMTRIRAEVLELKNEENINIVELVWRVVEQNASADNHPLALQIGQDAIVGNWDKARLEQVLDNLINNAVKYSPPNTLVTIGVEHQSEPTPEVIIWVRDEGYGISEEEQVHIFDRFYRGHVNKPHNVEGLGLGLYISREIITRQGGRMWLESKPGAGSTFYFSLPL